VKIIVKLVILYQQIAIHENYMYFKEDRRKRKMLAIEYVSVDEVK
jgi:hypothetical protein